jgi:general secretion pathway protein G
MDAKDLRYFVAVYEAKNFSRASERLGPVQSNVSKRMRKLEHLLGKKLFERRCRRRMVPTEIAEGFYQHAKAVLASLELTERTFKTPRGMAALETGFTLLELLVVVVIIGVLAGYVAPQYFSQVGKSEVQVARAQIDALEKALDQYRLDARRYPSTEQGLGALVERPVNESNWSGPYLRKGVPPDPWGRPYIYRSPGDKREFDLLSYGRDGLPGGTGENGDISNY